MIDRLIELSEKKTELLKELKEATDYENCIYDVRETPGQPEFYMLFEISTSSLIREGNAAYIRKWLERRNIKSNKVYNYNIIKYE